MDTLQGFVTLPLVQVQFPMQAICAALAPQVAVQ